MKDLIETSCKRNYWVFRSSVDNKWPKQIHIMFNQHSWAMLLFPFCKLLNKMLSNILPSNSFSRRFQNFKFKNLVSKKISIFSFQTQLDLLHHQNLDECNFLWKKKKKKKTEFNHSWNKLPKSNFFSLLFVLFTFYRQFFSKVFLSGNWCAVSEVIVLVSI